MAATHPTALRGTLVTFTGDPFLVDPASAFVHESDGLVVCRDGIIEAVGPYDSVASTLPKDIRSRTIPAASSRRPSSTLMSTMCRPASSPHPASSSCNG